MSQLGLSSSAGTAPGAGSGPIDACTLPSTCVDIETSLTSAKACCTPTTTCGYELPEITEEAVIDFPQVTEYYAQVTAGDPNGRCAPESFFFGPRPGLWEHRVEVDDGADILITPDCESYTVLAFILPGCCLPDDTCGLSTDESWSTLGYLANDMGARFASPECVPAEELNQQFRDSGTLQSFARTTASGTCSYRALDAALPPRN